MKVTVRRSGPKPPGWVYDQPIPPIVLEVDVPDDFAGMMKAIVEIQAAAPANIDVPTPFGNIMRFSTHSDYGTHVWWKLPKPDKKGKR